MLRNNLFRKYSGKKLRNVLQVEYVIMDKEQDDTFKEAMEEYRAASRAHIAKTSEVNSNSILKVLPRRQISNYFVQFRKIANHPLLVRRIYSDEDVVRLAEGYIQWVHLALNVP